MRKLYILAASSLLGVVVFVIIAICTTAIPAPAKIISGLFALISAICAGYCISFASTKQCV